MEFHIIRFGEIGAAANEHPFLYENHPQLLHPHLPLDPAIHSNFPTTFYAIEDGKIAAYIRSFPDQVFFAGKQYNWAWNANLYTSPHFRRRGLARSLLEHQISEFDHLNTIWGGVFSSPPALKLYGKLNFSMTRAAQRLVAVRNLRPFLDTHLPAIPASIIAGLYRVSFETATRLLSTPSNIFRKVMTEEISPEKFDMISDAQFNIRDDVVYWGREPKWTTKRLSKTDKDKILCFSRPGETNPFGYAIVRQRLNLQRPIKNKYFGIDTMTVMHYGCFDLRVGNDGLLLKGLFDFFKMSDADMFEIISSSPSMIRESKKLGFIRLGDGMSFKFKEPTNLKGKLPSEGSHQYHLTHFCGDGFSFE